MSGSLTTTTAQAASNFDASIGINVHANYYDTAYGNTSAWINAVLQGGFESVRVGFTTDSNLIAAYEQLAADGIKLDVVCDMHQVSAQTVASTLQANPAYAQAIWALEGPNEPDVNSMPDGGNWVTETQSYMQTLYSDIKGNSITSHIEIVAPSLAQYQNSSVVAQLGNLSNYVDYGNSHAYPGSSNGSANDAAVVESYIDSQQATNAPGKPVIVTEAGYSTEQPGASDAPAGNLPVSQAEQAILIPQIYFENFASGVAVTDIYELLDERPDGTWEDSLGVLNNDYSAKPAYTAIQSITTLLKDTGSSNFTPGQLTYSLQGSDANTASVLLEKHDGTFWLAVWEQVSDPSKSVPMTLQLASSANGSIFVPNDSGTNAVSTFSDTNTIQFDASAKVTLIEISGAAASTAGDSTGITTGSGSSTSGSGSTSTSGSGSSTLTLHVSGDMYNGDPQIQVLVDGQQVGSYDITAHHSQGASQTITIAGNWDPTTAHQVQIEYANDTWDGTSTADGHDRNVYVSDITMNGQDIAGSSGTNAATNGAITGSNASEAVMDIGGTLTFNVPADPPSGSSGTSGSTSGSGSSSTGSGSSSTGSLTLHVSGDTYNGDPQIEVFVDGKQVGGTYDISALHSQGQSQDLQISGDWDPTTAHQVQIVFVNDAWDGSSMADGHDRNVYVSGITMNGQDIAGSSGTNAATNGAIAGSNASEAVMDIGGTLTFNVPAESGAGGQGTSAPLVNPTFTDGVGNEVFLFSSMSQSGGQIADFNNHDILDLAPLLKSLGYTGTDPIGDHVVTLVQSGTDSTAVMVDPTGHDANHGQTLVTLDHVLPQNVSSSAIWH